MKDDGSISWVCMIFVWGFIIFLFFKFFVFPWSEAVIAEDRSELLILISLITLAIAFCSIAETTISGGSGADFTEWYIDKVKRPTKFTIWQCDLAAYTLRTIPRASAIIIMLNTILTVGISVATALYVNNNSHFQIFGMDGPQGFTIVGVTIILFVLGETVPKQIALKFRYPILLRIGFIPGILTKYKIFAWIGVGLTKPFLLLFGRQEE
jgi:CBS domain containing-hemolysin-like protein